MQADQMTNLISGFDMVCEEDYNPKCDTFLEMLYTAKLKYGDRFKVIMHAGESYLRTNTELYDAILLSTKRIGHGFNLIMHPNLIQIVKDEKICLECCPISNKVLGYVTDLRLHPVRSLLAQGVPVSISSDDPGFWCAGGVTLDYVTAYIEWGLSLEDLKQLALNSIEYSTIEESQKAKLKQFFDWRWRRFLSYVRGRY